jgi:hypothetical protein
MDQSGMLKLQTKTNKNITDICIIFPLYNFSLNCWETWIPMLSIILVAQSLFKYMFSIKLGASRSKDLGWRDYDQQFRMKKERSPSLSWGLFF